MMRDMTDDQRQAVLGELLMDELRAIREGIDRLNGLPVQVGAVDERLRVVESDVKIVKAAVTDLSQHVHDHEHRIGRLEASS